MISQKRGWIRIFEAVIAVLLVSSVLIYVVVKNEASTRNDVLREIVTNLQNNILEGIASDDYLRNATLSGNIPLLYSFVSSNLADPNYSGGYAFNYSLGVCAISEPVCSPSFPYTGEQITPTGDLFVQERLISSTLTIYQPKVVRFYVWPVQS
jgi:hypothetical protein